MLISKLIVFLNDERFYTRYNVINMAVKNNSFQV